MSYFTELRRQRDDARRVADELYDAVSECKSNLHFGRDVDWSKAISKIESAQKSYREMRNAQNPSPTPEA